MNIYAITAISTGHRFGEYSGNSRIEAIEAMATDAGYTSLDSMAESLGTTDAELVRDLRVAPLYAIIHANGREFQLKACGVLRLYESRVDLLDSIAPVLGLDFESAEWVRIDDEEYGGPQWLLYRSRDAADADDDGSGAIAIVAHAKAEQ